MVQAVREPALVVIDELHTYRGLFGSHVANVIRRLHGSAPTTAPTRLHLRQRHDRQPRELAERVLEAPVELVDDNGAPGGRRTSSSSTRRSRTRSSGSAARRCSPGSTGRAAHRRRRADDRLRPIANVGRGPPSYLRETFEPPRPPARSAATAAATCRTSATRSRRACATAASAASWPRTRSSSASTSAGSTPPSASATRGRSPRPGSRWAAPVGAPARASRRWSAPPRRSTSSSPRTRSTCSTARPSTGSSTRTTSTSSSTTCARSTFELPVPATERFGIDETPTLLDVLQEDGWIRRADDDRYYWSHENFPASDFSLRTGAPENVVIVDTTGDRHRVLGEIDLFAAPPRPREGDLHPPGRPAPRRSPRLGGAQGLRHAHGRRLLHRCGPRHHLKVLEVFERPRSRRPASGSAAR